MTVWKALGKTIEKMGRYKGEGDRDVRIFVSLQSVRKIWDHQRKVNVEKIFEILLPVGKLGQWAREFSGGRSEMGFSAAAIKNWWINFW